MWRLKCVCANSSRATSRFEHVEKFSLNFSNSSFAIHVNLLNPWPFLFLYVILWYFWCFSILIKLLFSGFLLLRRLFCTWPKHRDCVLSTTACLGILSMISPENDYIIYTDWKSKPGNSYSHFASETEKT